eukprot:TRINITY_DN7290_c0_g1_i1.p1 TRINITY_DN7290_c0_g1~~TRINITY_DN7290_c0_g1_i1.p1  ORF type:complete len:149 (-),score=16.84 TRINITY_DN7290_c0_g1_i1:31-477(-)
MGKKGLNLDSVSRQGTRRATSDHNIVKAGLNYTGHCENTSCSVRGESVVFNRGIGCYLVNDDIMNDVPRCPKCSNVFSVRRLSLFRCRAKVVIHDHQSSEDLYEVTGDEVLQLGSHGQNPNAAPARSAADCLVEITTRPLNSDRCIVS